MHNIKCPHSSTKMNPKSVGSRIEQSEMGNVKHVEIIPGPKRQAPPLPSSKRLFHLSLSLEWTSLKLKSSLCWFTLLFHILSQFSPKPLNPIKRKTSSSPPQLLYNTIPFSNGFNIFLCPVLPRLLTPLCPAISFFPSSCLLLLKQPRSSIMACRIFPWHASHSGCSSKKVTASPLPHARAAKTS